MKRYEKIGGVDVHEVAQHLARSVAIRGIVDKIGSGDNRDSPGVW